MRGIGQQGFVRLHQGFDPLGRVVEAPGQKGHLITAVGLHARRQVARAPALHATLQGLQPQGQAPHHRVGAQRHRQTHEAQHPAKAKTKGRSHPGDATGRALGPGQQQVQGLAVLGLHLKFQVVPQLAVGSGLRRANDLSGRVVHQHFADRQLRRVAMELPGRAHQLVEIHPPVEPDAHVKVRGKTCPHAPPQSCCLAKT